MKRNKWNILLAVLVAVLLFSVCGSAYAQAPTIKSYSDGDVINLAEEGSSIKFSWKKVNQAAYYLFAAKNMPEGWRIGDPDNEDPEGKFINNDMTDGTSYKVKTKDLIPDRVLKIAVGAYYEDGSCEWSKLYLNIVKAKQPTMTIKVAEKKVAVGDEVKITFRTKNAHHFYCEVITPGGDKPLHQTLEDDEWEYRFIAEEPGEYQIHAVCTTSGTVVSESGRDSTYNGLRDEADATVQVKEKEKAVPPEIRLSVDKDSCYIGDTVKVKIKVSDADHYYYTVRQPDGTEGAHDVENGNGRTLEVYAAMAGTYTVRTEASNSSQENDPNAQRDVKEIRFTVLPAPEPEPSQPVIRLSVDKDNCQIGETIRVSIDVRDADHYYYTVRQPDGTEGAHNVEKGSGRTLEIYAAIAGTYTVHTEASNSSQENDPNAQRDVKEIQFTVLPEPEPIPKSEPDPKSEFVSELEPVPVLAPQPVIRLSVDKDNCLIGETVRVSIDVHDADHYYYSVRQPDGSEGAHDVEIGNGRTLEVYATIPGTYTVHTEASSSAVQNDPYALMDIKEIQFTVSPVSEPASEPDSIPNLETGHEHEINPDSKPVAALEADSGSQPVIRLSVDKDTCRIGETVCVSIDVRDADHYYYSVRQPDGMEGAHDVENGNGRTLEIYAGMVGTYMVHTEASSSAEQNDANALRDAKDIKFTVLANEYDLLESVASDEPTAKPDPTKTPAPTTAPTPFYRPMVLNLSVSNENCMVGDTVRVWISVENTERYTYWINDPNGHELLNQAFSDSGASDSFTCQMAGDYEVHASAIGHPVEDSQNIDKADKVILVHVQQPATVTQVQASTPTAGAEPEAELVKQVTVKCLDANKNEESTYEVLVTTTTGIEELAICYYDGGTLKESPTGVFSRENCKVEQKGSYLVWTFQFSFEHTGYSDTRMTYVRGKYGDHVTNAIESNAFEVKKVNEAGNIGKWITPILPENQTSSFEWGEYSNIDRSGNRHYHVAIDYCANLGTPIYAAADGKVIKANTDLTSDNGIYAVIQHPLSDGTNVYALYAHMNSIDVLEGTSVSKGTIIGTVGKTGAANNTTHLHFSIVDRNYFGGSYYGYTAISDFESYDAVYTTDYTDEINGKTTGIIYYNPTYIIQNNSRPSIIYGLTDNTSEQGEKDSQSVQTQTVWPIIQRVAVNSVGSKETEGSDYSVTVATSTGIDELYVCYPVNNEYVNAKTFNRNNSQVSQINDYLVWKFNMQFEHTGNSDIRVTYVRGRSGDHITDVVMSNEFIVKEKEETKFSESDVPPSGETYSYRDYTDVSLEEIKAFLALYPNSVLNNSAALHGKYAAAYGEPGNTSMNDAFAGYPVEAVCAMDPAEIIYRSCVSQNCNVVYLLATLQKEQGLFTNESESRIKWATGYGVHEDDAEKQYGGFIQQVYWCARQQKYYQNKGYSTATAYSKYSPTSDGNAPYESFYNNYYAPFAAKMDRIMAGNSAPSTPHIHEYAYYCDDNLQQCRFCMICEPRTEVQLEKDRYNAQRLIIQNNTGVRAVSLDDGATLLIQSVALEGEKFLKQTMGLLYKTVTFSWSDIAKKAIKGSTEVNNMRRKALQQALSGILQDREKPTAGESEDVTKTILTIAAVACDNGLLDCFDTLDDLNQVMEAICDRFHFADKYHVTDSALIQYLKYEPLQWVTKETFKQNFKDAYALVEDGKPTAGATLTLIGLLIDTGMDINEYLQYSDSQRELVSAYVKDADKVIKILDDIKKAYSNDSIIQEYCDETKKQLLDGFSWSGVKDIAGITFNNIGSTAIDFVASGIPTLILGKAQGGVLSLVGGLGGLATELLCGTDTTIDNYDYIRILYDVIEQDASMYHDSENNVSFDVKKFGQLNMLYLKIAGMELVGGLNKGRLKENTDAIEKSLYSQAQKLIDY